VKGDNCHLLFITSHLFRVSNILIAVQFRFRQISLPKELLIRIKDKPNKVGTKYKHQKTNISPLILGDGAENIAIPESTSPRKPKNAIKMPKNLKISELTFS
jgi:hypothetical protein